VHQNYEQEMCLTIMPKKQEGREGKEKDTKNRKKKKTGNVSVTYH